MFLILPSLDWRYLSRMTKIQVLRAEIKYLLALIHYSQFLSSVLPQYIPPRLQVQFPLPIPT